MNDRESTPHGQNQYQVRFEWGADGAAAVADDVGVILVVDVLSFTTAVDIAASGGIDVVPRAPEYAERLAAQDGSALCAALLERRVPVVAVSLRNRRAVAQWVLDQQAARGDRFAVAVVAAGAHRSQAASTRFAIEDLLGAGAVIDALADLGIDYYSPEAAVASNAFLGSVNAIRQLITASASGRELVDSGFGDDVELAVQLDVSGTVPVLQRSDSSGEFAFRVAR